MDEKERNRIIASNIKSLIKSNNMTQKDLAEKIGISPSTLSDYMNIRSNPSHGVIQKIADYFGVVKSDIDTTYKDTNNNIITIYNKLEQPRQNIVLRTAEKQLYAQEQQSNVIPFDNSSNNNQLISFDWYGYASAGTGEYLDGNENKTTIQLPKKDIPENADFALTVNGDSMKPVFKNHEMIFVERTTDLSSGSIGIVVVEGEAFVKKIYIHDDCITLVSLNPTYKDKVIKDAQSIKVIGRVII
ncbi:S24 family peptidase [Melissococcus plutonius]|uniref:S24 family peptidase n=3 Tax=Melissococcus plutonius TaxID=33970 RepID=UPI003C2AFEDA